MTERPKASFQSGGEGGKVQLPKGVGAHWKDGAELSVLSFGADGAMLLRESVQARGFFCGTLSALSVGELLAQIVSGMRSGRLTVSRGTTRRTVSFRDGEVIFATSTASWERLGVVLRKLAIVPPEALEAALGEVGAGSKLGQVLTRKGLVTPAQLYSAMTYLVREIAVDLLAEEQGEFLFLEGAAPPADVLKLPQRTRELVLEGMGRVSDVGALRRRYGPEIRLGRGEKPAPPEGEVLWERAGAGTGLSALRPVIEASDYDFYRLVDDLVTSGVLVVRAPEPAPKAAQTPAALSALERFDRQIRLIAQRLSEEGQGVEALRSYLADPPRPHAPLLAGVTLSEGGELDVQRLLQNAGGSAAGRARAHEVLGAFVSYAVFSAKNVVGPEVAEKLSAELRKIAEGG